MKKSMKLVSILMAAVSAVTLMTAAVSASQNREPAISVCVDGKAVSFPDQEPIIKNDRTLVPIRFVAEALGYAVDWTPPAESSTQKGIAVIDGGRIKLEIGTNRAEINGEHIALDVVSELINDRTMVPLRIVSETLGCTVDWFGENNTVLVNKRNPDGTEMSVFERFKQSGLFWNYSTPDNEYLVWKADYSTLTEASNPTNFNSWWIERPTDKTQLTNQSFDCAIIMKEFNAEDLAQVKGLFYTVYPTKVTEAYDIMMKAVKGELWQTFYEETSEWCPLYSAMPASSGTFGSYYYDNREVEMYCNSTCTQLTININAEGYENPEIPRTLTQDEIDFYTAQAKQHYCLELWDLN